jgi:nucleoside-diphosphate-sugar epimerase
MKIAIIGCGYVGKAAAINWKEKGHEITATTRSSDRADELRPLVDRVILWRPETLSLILEDQDAILFSIAADTPQDYESAYLQNAQLLVSELPKFPKIKQLIYTSSTSVYGEHGGAWVDENTPSTPTSPQTQVLLETEKTFLKANIDVTIFRLGEILGPDRTLASRLRKAEGRPFPGTGEHLTNLIDLEDIVNALDFALTHNLKGIYNLVNDVHVPRRELYERICKEEGLPPVSWDPSKQSAHTSNKKVSNDNLKREGFVFKEEG